jgi:outer membrane protein assembly factor BamB
VQRPRHRPAIRHATILGRLTTLRRDTTLRSAILIAAIALLAQSALVGCGGPPPNCDSTPPPFDAAGELAADPDCPEPPPGPPPAPTPPGLPLPVCDGCGAGTADPHLRTFDQRRYDFQAAAELVATRSLVDDFEVQWRLVPSGESVSVIGAAAVRLDGERFEIGAGVDEPFLVDGEAVALAEGEQLERPSGATVRLDDRTYLLEAPGGTPWVTVSTSSSHLDVEIGLAPEQEGEVEGVLGDADGDPANDLVLDDGTVLPEDLELDDLYPDLADSWRVDDDTTLFDHPDGAGPDDWWDPDFPAKRLTRADIDPDVLADAEAACREAGVTDPDLLDDCSFDFAVTGDATFIDSAVRLQARRDAAIGTRSTGLARWDWLAPDLDFLDAPLHIDESGHVIVAASDTTTDALVLTALDQDDGEPAWSLEGTSARCAAVPTEAGIVALTDDESDDPDALVIVDDATGDIRDTPRYVPDPDESALRLDRCQSPLVATDDMVVGAFSETLRAFSTDDLQPAWELELDVAPSLDLLLSDDGRTLWVARPEDQNQSVRVLAVDPTTGTVVAETVLDRVRVADRRGAAPAGDDLVLSVGAPGDDSRSGAIVALEIDGSDLRTRWEVSMGEEDGPDELERTPSALAIAGDHVVGFTTSQVVTAFDLGDGDVAWSSEASSFSNNGGLVAGDDEGRTSFSSFGGDWLEIVGPDGDNVETVEATSIFGPAGAAEIRLFGPVVDGALVVLAPAEDGGLVMAAIDLTEIDR